MGPYILEYGSGIDLFDDYNIKLMTKKDKYKYIYVPSKQIDYTMLDPNEIIGGRIIDFDLLQDDPAGDELIISLNTGKQIEICLIDGRVHVQSD